MRIILLATTLLFSALVFANDAHIEHVVASKSGSTWSFDVTIRHNDTGWEHYADGWRVVDENGSELGMRVLYHPHETEQPFTRSLSGVSIPSGTTIIYIEARDKVHGWNKDKVKIDLTTSKGDRYEVVK